MLSNFQIGAVMLNYVIKGKNKKQAEEQDIFK